MYDLLLTHQGKLGLDDLEGYAQDLGLDVDRFSEEIRRREYAARVADDVASADESGVSGTPTFFINGRRHYGRLRHRCPDAGRAGRQEPDHPHRSLAQPGSLIIAQSQVRAARSR